VNLSLSPETLRAEIASIRHLLDGVMEAAEQVPVEELPAPEERLEDFVRRVAGELALAARKCHGLAEVLSGEL